MTLSPFLIWIFFGLKNFYTMNNIHGKKIGFLDVIPNDLKEKGEPLSKLVLVRFKSSSLIKLPLIMFLKNLNFPIFCPL